MHRAALVFMAAIERMVRDDKLDLDYRAKQVRETIESPGWQFLSDLLAAQREHLLSLGAPTAERALPSQAEYANYHGQVAGIDYALHVSDAVIESAKRAEEKHRRLVAVGGEQR